MCHMSWVMFDVEPNIREIAWGEIREFSRFQIKHRAR